MPTAAAHLGPGAAATAASAVANTAAILPHGAWWTPPGARCTRTDACSRMLHWWQGDEHGDGEGAAVVATTRRSSATAALCLSRLFCLMVRYSCGTVMLRLGHARGNCGYSGSRRDDISDFGAAAESDEGRWVRPTFIATADVATAGPNIGRDPVRPFSPDLGLEVEEGCGPCVLRPPAPWDTRQPSVRRRRPWVDHARCFCSSSKNCGVDATRTAGHRTEPHPGWGLQF